MLSRNGNHLLIWSMCGGSACGETYGFTVVDVDQPKVISPTDCDEVCAARLTASKLPFILNHKDAVNTATDDIAVVQDKTYQKIDVEYITLDAGKLEGKYVELSRLMFYNADRWTIRTNEDSQVLIYVDTQFLPREALKAMLSCHIFCHVILRGSVRPADTGKWGVTADSVELH